MSVDEAIEEYGLLSNRVFGTKKWLRFSEGKFKASTLEEILKTVIARKVYDPDARMLEKEGVIQGPACKV